jgi:hypothetical protein
MFNVRKGLVRLAVAGAVMAAALGVMPTTSGAVNPTPLACLMLGGRIDTAGGAGGVTWNVQGRGSCTGDFNPPYIVTATGTGTSSGAGLCTGSLITTDLVLNMTITLQNSVTGGVVTQHQRWTVPLTLGVLAHPFLIGGDTIGAGSAFSRIFLQCPPGGDPAATFDWLQPI